MQRELRTTPKYSSRNGSNVNYDKVKAKPGRSELLTMSTLRRGSCPDVVQLPPTILTVLQNRARSTDFLSHDPGDLTLELGRDQTNGIKPVPMSAPIGNHTFSDPLSCANNSFSDPALSGHLSVPDRDLVTRTFSNPEQSPTGRYTRPTRPVKMKHKVSLGKQFCNFKPCDDTILEETVLHNGAATSEPCGMRVKRHATSTPNIGRQCENENSFCIDAPTFHSLRKGSEPARPPDQGVVGQMKRYSIQINHTLENVAHRILGERSSKDATYNVSIGALSGISVCQYTYFFTMSITY